MFNKTYLKLAGLYLTVFMIISLFFSISLYQISLQDVQSEMRWRSNRFGRIMTDQSIPQNFRDQYILDIGNHYQEAKEQIIGRLILINIFVLIAGGVLSYLLAKWTLRPIEQAHMSLEQFTADASHELRTPIAAMQTEIEVALMDSKLTVKEAKNQLNSNLEELAKMTALTDRLLKLARINDGTILPLQDIRAFSVVEDSIARVIKLAKAKNININNNINKKLLIFGDYSSLEELFLILLENAIKYSKENKSISVDSHKIGKKVTISVTDQGVGINNADISKIFDRFYRSDSSRTKNANSGFGLGLSIARNIAKINNAKLSVKSTVGVGSVFSLDIESNHSNTK